MIKNIKLSTLQKIYNIDPNHEDIIIRKMLDCYNVGPNELKQLEQYIDFNVDLNKYDYQTGSQVDDLGHVYYIISEFEKGTPWIFEAEYPINIEPDTLREIFKEEGNPTDPNDVFYEQLISYEQKFVTAIEQYINFKFDVEHYDYFIEKRRFGEPRDPEKNLYY